MLERQTGRNCVTRVKKKKEWKQAKKVKGTKAGKVQKCNARSWKREGRRWRTNVERRKFTRDRWGWNVERDGGEEKEKLIGTEKI